MSELNHTVNWTPEPAHERKPEHPRSHLAWTLWIVAAVLIAIWVASMALGARIGGYAHLLLAAAAALIVICVAMGFRNVAYLEPMRVARQRIMAWRWMRGSRRGEDPGRPGA